MKLRPALAAALLLPIIGFGASWAVTYQKAQQGTDWDVPITGYDPRDLLRGHYIQYSYEWPGLGRNEDGSVNWSAALCIEGRAPLITRVRRLENEVSVKCDSIFREPNDGMTDLYRGRFYVPQTQAHGLENKLREQKLQGIMRVRIREDGVLTPISLKFRPLNAAEIEARKAGETDRSPAPLTISR